MSSSTGSATLEDLFTEVLGDLFEDLGGLRIEYSPEAERLFGIEDYQETPVTENPCGDCPCGGSCKAFDPNGEYEYKISYPDVPPVNELRALVIERLTNVLKYGISDEDALFAIETLREMGEV